MGLLLGVDFGTSAVKASLLDPDTGCVVASSVIPQREIPRLVTQPGWCEQDPDDWWAAFLGALASLDSVSLSAVSHIGIAYQMHGLVLVDAQGRPVRNSIIWSDSRAVACGEKILEEIGPQSVGYLLNKPGNFTAAKLRWVRENEPSVFAKAKFAMLPGDYLALRLTGEASTTANGLSEMVAWNYLERRPSNEVWQSAAGGSELMPELRPCLGIQGKVTKAAASVTGLPEATPVTYRAGDQPNNAFSLNVSAPGEVAATAGTSGVLYGVTSNATQDPYERVNTFLHPTLSDQTPRLGVLLCINGAGAFYSWIRKLLGVTSFEDLNDMAAQSQPGSSGLIAFPFGNGGERLLGNEYLGAAFTGIDLNRHVRSDVARSAQEGIVFALRYGFEVMQELGIEPSVIRAGTGNMFQSHLFSQTFADVMGVDLELYSTDGSAGAARAAGLGGGVFGSAAEAHRNLDVLRSFTPSLKNQKIYQDLYKDWKRRLRASTENHDQRKTAQHLSLDV